jgi:hypothetical protein
LFIENLSSGKGVVGREITDIIPHRARAEFSTSAVRPLVDRGTARLDRRNPISDEIRQRGGEEPEAGQDVSRNAQLPNPEQPQSLLQNGPITD